MWYYIWHYYKFHIYQDLAPHLNLKVCIKERLLLVLSVTVFSSYQFRFHQSCFQSHPLKKGLDHFRRLKTYQGMQHLQIVVELLE